MSEQLSVYESIVTEYERISGHTYGDDNKVASIQKGKKGGKSKSKDGKERQRVRTKER